MSNSHATKYEKQISQFKYKMLIKTSDVFNKVPASVTNKIILSMTTKKYNTAFV